MISLWCQLVGSFVKFSVCSKTYFGAFWLKVLHQQWLKSQSLYVYFDILLTVHLCINLAITNLMHKIFFYNKFIIRLYMFRALCAHHQEVKIVLHSIWYHHTYRWASRAQFQALKLHRTATYRCDDTRCCIIQFWPPGDEHSARNV